jgi:PIN domain nuclease of toxin-antitoxin system
MIILDTCIVLWDALNKDKLSAKAAKLIATGYQKGQLAVSDITWWEIAMLCHKGRIKLSVSPEKLIDTYCVARKISALRITPIIAAKSVGFDNTVNTDPADRIILATTIVNNAKLITADKNLLASAQVKTVW